MDYFAHPTLAAKWLQIDRRSILSVTLKDQIVIATTPSGEVQIPLQDLVEIHDRLMADWSARQGYRCTPNYDPDRGCYFWAIYPTLTEVYHVREQQPNGSRKCTCVDWAKQFESGRPVPVCTHTIAVDRYLSTSLGQLQTQRSKLFWEVDAPVEVAK